MENQSIFNSQPKGGISEDFRQYIKETIEEVLVEGRAFDGQKRWLHRLGETEVVDCNALERNMTDLIEVVEEWKQLKSKSGERMARMLGKECYLTEQDIDGLLQKLEGGNPAVVSATTPTQDASMMGESQSAEDEYISECIKEVCINGDSLSKYQKIIEKKYGVEFYQKCEGFVEEMKRSVKRKKFTNTSITNLKYLANEIHVSESTIDVVMNHFYLVIEKYPKVQFIKNPKGWFIPKWFWWTLPIQLGAIFFSLGALLIFYLILYFVRRKPIVDCYVEETQNKYARISNCYKLGLYNKMTMRLILPVEYDGILDIGTDIYLIEKDGKVGAVRKNRIFIPVEYDKIELKEDGVFAAKKESDIHYFTKDGIGS